MSSKEDEAYERGVRDGQSGGLFDDVIQGSTKGIGGRLSDIYDKGYKWGAQHRDYSSKDEDNSQEQCPSDTESSVAHSGEYGGDYSGNQVGDGKGYLVVLVLAGIAVTSGTAMLLYDQKWKELCVALPVFSFFVWMIIDCVKHEEEERLAWLLVMCFIPGGVLVYFLMRKLSRW